MHTSLHRSRCKSLHRNESTSPHRSRCTNLHRKQAHNSTLCRVHISTQWRVHESTLRQVHSVKMVARGPSMSVRSLPWSVRARVLDGCLTQLNIYALRLRALVALARCIRSIDGLVVQHLHIFTMNLENICCQSLTIHASRVCNCVSHSPSGIQMRWRSGRLLFPTILTSCLDASFYILSKSFTPHWQLSFGCTARHSKSACRLAWDKT